MTSEVRQRWAWVGSLAPLALGALGLLGWLWHIDALKTFLPGANPMAPNSVFAFLSLGLASVVSLPPAGLGRRRFVLWALAVPAAVAAAVIVGYFQENAVLFDAATTDSAGGGPFPVGRMSPVTAGLVLISCAALAMGAFPGAAAVLAGVSGLSGMVLTAGYLYGVPLFYQGSLIPPALNTALVFWIWGTGAFLAVAPDSPWLRSLFDGSLKARVFLGVLPWVIGLVLLEGWVSAVLVPEGEIRAILMTLLSVGLAAFIVVVVMTRVRSVESELKHRSLRLEGERVALRDSEASFRLALDRAGVPIMIHAEDGRIELVNRLWCALTGYQPEELPTTAEWMRLAYGDRGPQMLQVVQRIYETGQGPGRVEYAIRTKAQATLIWEFVASPMGVLPDGRRAVIVIAKDITGLRQTAEAAQRSQRLEALGTLAGGIAHDFNNLLASLYGFIELARLRTTDSGVEAALEKAGRSLDRARDLTRQLLTFAKGGEPVFAVEPLFPLVEETVRFALSGSPVDCVFDAEPDLAPSRFDRHQLAQIVDNLVINAVQAMPGGGTLTVRGLRRSLGPGELPGLGEGAYNCLVFADTGVGIAPEVLPRIFDPFFTTKALGHGLGLATCHSIAKRHGGTILAESEPGRGTTMTVYLPVASATVTAVASAPVEPNLEFRGEGLFLVMDDEESLRELLAEELQSLGFEVVTASDGEEALSHLARNRGDPARWAGLLLDLTVPGGRGGLEIHDRARSLAPGVPIFVTSGYTEDPVLASPARYGFAGALLKPFSHEDLIRLLTAAVPS